ncbi:hypothetical protein KR084_008706, partial [Drosophila pseudotakahashii]
LNPSRSRPGEWQKAESRKRASKNRRPEAVIIEANGKSYSEVLAMVTRRSDGKLQDLSESVNKVRRTACGNLLLELSSGSNSSAVLMKKDLESVLEGAAAVRALSEDTRVQFLVVSDLDPLVVAEDPTRALVDQFDVEANAVKLKSLRPAFRYTQSATIGLPCKDAKAVLAKGKIKVGWTVCRVRESDSKLRAAHDLLQQTVREQKADYAILSEPYRTGDDEEWTADLSGKAAIWRCGRSAQNIREVRRGNGFVRGKTFNRAGAGSVIDLTFASPSLARQAFWRIGDYFTASDHEAIMCSLGVRPSRTQPQPRIVKAYRTD